MQQVACIIAVCSQSVFFFFELVQLVGEGPYDYLFKLGIWNVADLLRFALTVAYVVIRAEDNYQNPFQPLRNGKDHASRNFTEIFILWFIEILAMIKVTQFLGIYRISFLVQMVILCFKKLGGFITFLVIFATAFAALSQTLQINYTGAVAKPGVADIFQMLL